jgi:transposase
MPDEILTRLLGFQEVYVRSLTLAERQGRSAVIVELGRTARRHTCGGCGRPDLPGHDHTWREVQHLPWWHHLTVVRFQRYRVACPACGIRTEALPFVEIRGPHVTTALAALVAELCKVMTNEAVGLLHSLHRGTVKAIDKRAMAEVQASRPLGGITVLGLDEIAVGQGHRYWTMVSALESPRGPELLYVVEGRKERPLKKFWKWFGKDRAAQITHAVMDMWKPFRKSVLAHCPGVALIYDKFHVVRHLLNALNAVRQAEFKKAAGRFRGMLAGKKFILLSRQAHVRGHARDALNGLLLANRRLFKAHLLKESFGHLWSYTSKTWAMKFWTGWKASLKWSRLEPYHRFAKMLDAHLEGILAHCDKRVSLGYLEATNLIAKNVIRRAYGYRDKDYMRLKIIQACTPWMRQFHPWTHTFSS